MVTNPQQEKPVEKKQCEQCTKDLPPVLVTLAFARSSCETLKDPEKKGQCVDWAENLKLEDVEDMHKALMDTYRKTGREGVGKVSALFNNQLTSAMMEVIEEKMAKGEPVDDADMKDYVKWKREARV